MAKNSMVASIDIKRNNGSATTVTFGGGGGGSVDTSVFLLLDGTRAMLGNLDMGLFNINNVGTVDGVDVSAHAANVNAHHNQVHTLDGTDHTGTLSWAKVSKVGSNLTDIETRSHDSLQGITANQHHNQVHDITSSDHTWAGKTALSLVGIPTTTGVLGAVIPSSNVTTATAAVLATNSSGQVTIKRIIGGDFVQSNAYMSAATYMSTPELTSAANLLIDPTTDVQLEPGGAVTLKLLRTFKSAGAITGWTGNGFTLNTTASGSLLDVDNLTVRGTMRVYELIIQRIRATNGSIAVTSSGKVDTASFSTPSWTITTIEDHGFLENDLIRAQAFNGSSAGAVIYRSDLTVTSVTGPKTFVATKRTGTTNPAPDMEFVRIGNTTNAARQGLLYLTADEAMGPYMDVVNGVSSYGIWEGTTGYKVKVRIGNVEGVTSVANDYGIVAFNGQYDGATTPQLRLTTNGFIMKNIGLEMWLGATAIKRVEINPDGTMYLRDAAGTTKFSWNGSALDIDGSGTFSGSITASSGTIGGWSITSSQIANSTGRIKLVSGGDGVARLELYHQTVGLVEYGAGMVARASATGIAIWAGVAFSNIANAPFKVLMDGTTTLTSAIIKNGASSTMQIDDNGIHFVPNNVWGETKGYLFRTAIAGTALGGMFGNYAAAGNFSTGIWANSVDGATAAVSNLDANVYMTALSGSTKNAVVQLKASKGTATSSIVVTTANASPGNGINKIVLDAENGGGKVAVYRTGVYYEVWDDYYASTKALAYTDSTNVTFTGSGYLQTSQKLGEAWTNITFNTSILGTATGTVSMKRFGDLVIMKGAVKFTQSTNQGVITLVDAANWPTNFRRAGSTIVLDVFVTDGTQIKITLPPTGNVTLTSWPGSAANKDILFEHMMFAVS